MPGAPGDELLRQGFDLLLDADRVNGVERDEQDGVSIASQHGAQSLVSNHPAGVQQLAALKEVIGEHFTTMGHKHWGTELDLAILSETLNVGFVILSSTAQGGQRWIKNYGATRADFPFWVILYNHRDVHNQLAGLRAGVDGITRLAFHYALADMPAALTVHWERRTRLPLGQASRGGFS